MTFSRAVYLTPQCWRWVCLGSPVWTRISSFAFPSFRFFFFFIVKLRAWTFVISKVFLMIKFEEITPIWEQVGLWISPVFELRKASGRFSFSSPWLDAYRLPLFGLEEQGFFPPLFLVGTILYCHKSLCHICLRIQPQLLPFGSSSRKYSSSQVVSTTRDDSSLARDLLSPPWALERM